MSDASDAAAEVALQRIKQHAQIARAGIENAFMHSASFPALDEALREIIEHMRKLDWLLREEFSTLYERPNKEQ